MYLFGLIDKGHWISVGDLVWIRNDPFSDMFITLQSSKDECWISDLVRIYSLSFGTIWAWTFEIEYEIKEKLSLKTQRLKKLAGVSRGRMGSLVPSLVIAWVTILGITAQKIKVWKRAKGQNSKSRPDPFLPTQVYKLPGISTGPDETFLKWVKIPTQSLTEISICLRWNCSWLSLS